MSVLLKLGFSSLFACGIHSIYQETTKFNKKIKIKNKEIINPMCSDKFIIIDEEGNRYNVKKNFFFSQKEPSLFSKYKIGDEVEIYGYGINNEKLHLFQNIHKEKKIKTLYDKGVLKFHQ